MQRLLAAGEYAFTHHQASLLPATGKPKPKMKRKRALAFAILMATLASTYYFYTLNFQPHSVSDDLAQNEAIFRNGDFVFHVRPKDSGSQDNSKGLVTDKDERHQKKFQLFPKGIGYKNSLENGEEVNKELQPGNIQDEHLRRQPTSPSGFADTEVPKSHQGDGEDSTPEYDKHFQDLKANSFASGAKDDAANRDLSDRMLEQQRLIEKQAQMLKQLQEQFQAQQQQQQFPVQQQQPFQNQPQSSSMNQPQNVLGGQTRTPIESRQKDQFQGLSQGQEASSRDERQGPGQRLEQPIGSQEGSPGQQAVQAHTPLPNNSRETVNSSPFNVPPPPDTTSYPEGKGDSLLDRVENFNGEIKGRFNGLIFRDEKAPVQLAVNGVQPRRLPTRDRQDGVVNQDQAVQQEQHKDAETMFEQARQKGRVMSGGQLSQQFKNPAEQGQILTTIPKEAESIRDAAKMFEEASQKNRAMLDKLQNASEQDSKSQPDSPVHNNAGQLDSAAKSDQSMLGEKVHRELIPLEEETSAGAAGEKSGLPKYLPGQSLENQVEQKIQNDQLLEDRFQQIKNDFEGDVKPGVEPKIFDTENRADQNAAVAGKPPPGKLVATVYDLKHELEGKLDFPCVALRLRVFSRMICVYPQNTDTGASRQIIQRGTWEERELEEFQAALNTDPALGAVDLGAGLGVYTLAAANLDRPVVAVEPLKDNIHRFHKTMQLNAVTDKVTLITDALGDKVGAGRVRYPHPSGNIGAAYVDPVDLSDVGPGVTDLVRIVTLDDVIPVMTFSRAVVKLDVQGDESKVLKGARRFFSQIDVQYLFMHWLPAQDKLQYKMTESFLRQYGMEPVKSVKNNTLYSDSELSNDINFIIWRKIRNARL